MNFKIMVKEKNIAVDFPALYGILIDEDGKEIIFEDLEQAKKYYDKINKEDLVLFKYPHAFIVQDQFNYINNIIAIKKSYLIESFIRV